MHSLNNLLLETHEDVVELLALRLEVALALHVKRYLERHALRDLQSKRRNSPNSVGSRVCTANEMSFSWVRLYSMI
jgi:hypothetical protein